MQKCTGSLPELFRNARMTHNLQCCESASGTFFCLPVLICTLCTLCIVCTLSILCLLCLLCIPCIYIYIYIYILILCILCILRTSIVHNMHPIYCISYILLQQYVHRQMIHITLRPLTTLRVLCASGGLGVACSCRT